MPPPIDHPSLALSLLDNIYVVRKYDKDKSLPESIMKLFNPDANETFVSITKTSEEISIVSSLDNEPGDGLPKWKCIKIKGPMDFGLTGIMCDFTTPLKQAGISIFAISTWNTDYILVPESSALEAVAVLQSDGWKFN